MTLSLQIEEICRALLFKGKNGKEIHRHLTDLHHKVTYQSILTFIKDENNRKSGSNKGYKSYVFGDETEKVEMIVKDTYGRDKRQSERQVRTAIKREHGIDISRGVLQSIKKANNLKAYAPIAVPNINPVQSVKRLAMVTKWINHGETFDYWLFSDECSVSLSGNTHQITTDDPKDPARLVATHQFPEKVAIWAVISRLGKGPLVFLERMERLKDINYLDILEHHLLPFIDSTYGRQHAVYMQDGARCHTSRHAMHTLTNQWGLKVADWAPSSPDLNPIEYIWRELKIHVEWESKPTTRLELIEAIEDFWRNKVTTEMINKYYDHCIENAKAVKKANGHAIVDSQSKHVYN